MKANVGAQVFSLRLVAIIAVYISNKVDWSRYQTEAQQADHNKQGRTTDASRPRTCMV